jgi:probable addiction module antidote protein
MLSKNRKIMGANQEKTDGNLCLVSYHDSLIERLKDHEYAVVYLNAALEESLKGDTESQKLFLSALRNVAEAQDSMSDLARRAHIRRESLYRMLSKNGNPELNSLVSLLHAMGFSLSVR